MRDSDLASAVLRILLRAIRNELRDSVRGAASDARLGAVSFLHRLGSGLNPHPHFHLAVTDALFARECGEEGAPLRFHPAVGLDAERARALTPIIQRRVLGLYVRRRLLSEADAADMLTWQGTGGFSIDASVRIDGHDRHGLERLVRYCARPPFALNRLHAMGGNEALRSPDARLLYRLTGPTPDGRTVLVLSPLELLQRLARLVPPPRVHRHRYHGVLAPNARLRPQVIALQEGEPKDGPPVADDESESSESPESHGTVISPSPARSGRIR